jgi:hypothetical protein
MSLIKLLFSQIYPAIIAALPLIGFIRFSIDGKPVKNLLEVDQITRKWLEPNTWISRFTPLFSILAFIYNLFVWGIYGFTSIFEFIGFLISRLWWVLSWIWKEVLHPTLFSLIKLLWYYIIIFSWKFFQFALRLIKPLFTINNFIHAFKSVLILSGSLSLVWILYSLFNSGIILYAGIAGLFFLLQYLVYSSVVFYRSDNYSEFWVLPSLKVNLIWLAISASSAGIIALLREYAEKHLVSGLGVSLSQVIVPLAVLLLAAVILSVFYLAPHLASKNGEIKVQDFLKEIFVRLPKLIFSQPFQIIGLGVAALIPFLISYFLLSGIELTTQKSSQQWQSEIVKLPVHVPVIFEKRKEIKILDTSLIKLEQKLQTDTVKLANDVFKINAKMDEAIALRKLIKENEIFTFEGDAFVGESQIFTIPENKSCPNFKWEIKDNFTNRIIRTFASLNEISNRWERTGSYTVSVIPSNSCTDASVVSLNVRVNDKPPQKPRISAPSGKTSVYTGNVEKYIAQKGFETYSWQIPEGAIVVSAQGDNINIKWGNTPGTVRVKGTKENGESSNWAGILVSVMSAVGSEPVTAVKIEDEKAESISYQRPFLFYTIQAANTYMAKLKSTLASLKDERNALIISYQKEKSNIVAQQSNLKAGIKDHILRILGLIFAILGFSLLISIASVTIWTYFILFNFDIYKYEQEGKHYWEELISDLQKKNPDQPLLGLFVIAGIPALVYILLKVYHF